MFLTLDPSTPRAPEPELEGVVGMIAAVVVSWNGRSHAPSLQKPVREKEQTGQRRVWPMWIQCPGNRRSQDKRSKDRVAEVG